MVHDNDAAWLGDGWTVAERNENMDRAYYLNPENIDFPPVPHRTTNGTNGTNGHTAVKV
jgi:hypothetical protein